MIILEILNEDKWLEDYKFFEDFKNSLPKQNPRSRSYWKSNFYFYAFGF